MHRHVDAPGKAFLSAQEAGRWLGIGADFFEQLAAGEDWMRPVELGQGRRRRRKWPWMDVFCFAWVMTRRGVLPAGRPPGENTTG